MSSKHQLLRPLVLYTSGIVGERDLRLLDKFIGLENIYNDLLVYKHDQRCTGSTRHACKTINEVNRRSECTPPSAEYELDEHGDGVEEYERHCTSSSDQMAAWSFASARFRQQFCHCFDNAMQTA